MITDGKQTTTLPYTRLSEASRGMKNKGVTVYAIGVGSGADRAELEEIASGPSYIFTSSSFSDLQSIAPRITKRLCAGRITDHVVFRAIILRFEKVLNISRVCSYTFFPFIPPVATKTTTLVPTPTTTGILLKFVFRDNHLHLVSICKKND